MKITTTTVTQTGNEVLGTKEKNLYYLIVENNIGKKLIINVGQKTHDNVLNLIETEEVNTPEAEERLRKQKGGK